jgi:Skp family chaperone for outer membrane proteins
LRFFYLIIFFSVNFFSSVVVSQTIAIVDIQSLIDNNEIYIKILKKIENSQDKHVQKFNLQEKNLEDMFIDIENSKLILNENELNQKIEIYNNELTEFTKLLDDFNSHYQKQIINTREIFLREIIILLEQYAINNNVDLILDSTSYLIASNTLDITKKINKDLMQLEIEMDFKDFEKN